jgi:predicted CopG family antitoxin
VTETLTNNEIRFFIQNSKTILPIVQNQFRIGISSDDFIPFLREYMFNAAGNRGFATGLQQRSGQNVILSSRNILQAFPTPNEVGAIVDIIKQTNFDDRNPQFNMAMRNLDTLRDVVDFNDIIVTLERLADETRKAEILEQLTQSLNNLPTKTSLNKVVRTLQQGLQARDMSAVSRSLFKMAEISAVSPDAVYQLNQIRVSLQIRPRSDLGLPRAQARELVRRSRQTQQQFSDAVRQENERRRQRRDAPAGETKDEREDLYEEKKEEQTQNILPRSNTRRNDGGKRVQYPSDETEARELWNFLDEDIFNNVDNMTDLYVRDQYDIIDRLYTFVQKKSLSQQVESIPSFGEVMKKQNIRTLRQLFKNDEQKEVLQSVIKMFEEETNISNQQSKTPIQTIMQSPAFQTAVAEIPPRSASSIQPRNLGAELSPASGRGMRPRLHIRNKVINGKGITKKRPPPAVDYSRGVVNNPRFVPFGRYIINTKKLDDDIIAIKRNAGSHIKNLPSTKVSKTFGNIVRKIVGNGTPSFDDMNSLTDEEKNYLHKVAKESHLLDKLSIPAPNKSEIDKLTNHFETMKGQIIAGNDNAEMVKDFKKILMKLSALELIPKSDVRDILMDLTSMGY